MFDFVCLIVLFVLLFCFMVARLVVGGLFML